MSVDHVVVITGASRGLGAATALWLARVGAKVALLARSETALNQLAAEIERSGGSALPLVTDLVDPDACHAAVSAIRKHYHRIDALINNAGVLEPIANVAEVDPAAFRRNFDLNFMAPFTLTQALLPDLKQRRGRIINVSSGAAQHAVEAWSAYCSAKAALNHFSAVLAAEEPTLTVVALRPGVIDTGMQAVIRAKGSGHMSADKVAYFKQLKSNQQLEPPMVPARCMAWLALKAPKRLSGSFVDYADPQIDQPARDYFGDRFETNQ